MKVAIAFLLVITAFVAVFSVDEEETYDISHGFGTDIDWVSWDNAINLGKELNKPVFLLIHKTWCGACKALKKNFKGSNKRAEFVELSKKFVMVNLEDDEEPDDERYAPDGAYIPRLFFLDINGDLLAVDNKKNYPNNAYYFPQAVDVLKAMKVALKEFGGDASTDDVETEKDTTTVKDEKKKDEAVSDKKKAKKEKTEEKEDKKKAAETTEKKEDKKKEEKKTEKPEKKETKESEKKDKTEKKDKKEAEKKTEKKEKSEKAEKADKKEKSSEKKSEKKEEKKQKDSKKETKEKDSKKDEKKQQKKSDDEKSEKKSKKDGDKKKKTEL